jgi:hypothetical protein
MIILLAVVGAMLALTAGVALAQEQQQSQYQYNSQTSGDVTTGGVFAFGGDDSIVQQSAAMTNQINTGNQSSQQAVQQYRSADEGSDQARGQYATNTTDQSISFDATQAQFASNGVFQTNDNFFWGWFWPF